MREYPTIDVPAIGDLNTREALGIVDLFLRDLSFAMRRLSQGQIPDASGTPITSVIDDGLFWKLLGRSNGQIGFGGINASENATVSSTRSATKGFVYLGTARLGAFDEVNTRLGINESTPDARLHLHSDLNPGVYGRPGAPVGSPGSFSGSPSVGGSNHYQNIDETVADDNTTYLFTPSTLAGSTVGESYKITPFTADSPRSGWTLRWKIGRFDPSSSGDTRDWDYKIRIQSPLGGDVVTQGFTPIGGTIGSYNTTYSYALSSAEMAAIDPNDAYFFVDFRPMGFGFSSNEVRITFLELEIDPSGSVDATPLQRWSLAADSAMTPELAFVSDGASSFDLKLTGTPAWLFANGGGTSGLRALTSSTNARLEAGSSAQANMNLVLSGNRAATGTLLTADFTTTLFKGAVRFEDPGAGTNYIGLTAPTTPTTHTLTLPGTLVATSFLKHSSGGTLSWSTISSTDLPSHDHSSATTGGSMLAPVEVVFQETADGNPSANNFRLYARASGSNIQLVGRSSTGAECIICTLLDGAVQTQLLEPWGLLDPP